MVDKVGDIVDNLAQLSQVLVEEGQDRAEAGEELDAVIDANESVITGVRLKIVLLHDVLAGGRDSNHI